MDRKRRLLFYGIIFIIAGLPVLLRAQFNDSLHYYTGITSTGTYNQTNSNRTFLLNNVLRLGVRRKHFSFNSLQKYLYGRQGEKIVNADFSSVLDLNLYPRQTRIYYWGLLTYNTIYSLRINNQLQTGLGLAIDLIDGKKIQFNISDGLIYDFNDVQLRDTVRDVYQTYRNSFRMQYKMNLGNLSLRATGFIQNSFEYRKDFIIKTDFTLAYRVRKWLSFTMQSSYNKMNRTNRETLFITYGLTFERYF